MRPFKALISRKPPILYSQYEHSNSCHSCGNSHCEVTHGSSLDVERIEQAALDECKGDHTARFQLFRQDLRVTDGDIEDVLARGEATLSESPLLLDRSQVHAYNVVLHVVSEADLRGENLDFKASIDRARISIYSSRLFQLVRGFLSDRGYPVF